MQSTTRPQVLGFEAATSPEPVFPELVDVIAFVLDEHDIGVVEVGLTSVDPDAIADLNVQHLGVDGPTDVLAFPIDEEVDIPDGVPRMLGELVICPDVARLSIDQRGDGTLADELRLLVVHGTLHLLGMDHAAPDEREAMAAEQNRLLVAWAARTGAPVPPRTSLPSAVPETGIAARPRGDG